MFPLLIFLIKKAVLMNTAGTEAQKNIVGEPRNQEVPWSSPWPMESVSGLQLEPGQGLSFFLLQIFF